MRLALLPLLLCGGCFIGGGLAAGSALVVPPVIGATAAPLEGASQHATLGGVSARGGGGQDGGWGVSLDTSSGGPGYLAHGKVELGRWGRDNFYGSTGAEVGTGFVQGGFGGGVMIGYGYGGFVQNGHKVPLQLMGFARLGPINLRLSGYAGWRFGVRDEFPHAASSWGPGWNTFGGELSTILVVKGEGGSGAGLSIGLGVDRQDDVDVTWLKVGVGVGIVQ